MTATRPFPGGAGLLEPDEGDAAPMTAAELQQLAERELAAEFRIEAPLADGRWGPRFLAEDLARKEPVLLSLIPPPIGADNGAAARYLEPLKGASLLDHPHLIPICAYGVSAGLRWFAVAAHSDLSLREQLARTGPFPFPTVKRIAQQIASTLDQAHRRGMVHGALTTDEVMIAPDGWVRVEGIGIAAAAEPVDVDDPDRLAAPSQGSDQVALAMIIRECLTGAPDAPLPEEFPASLEAALARAVRPRPAERFRDLLDLVAALDGVGTTHRPLRPSLTIGERARPDGWQALLTKEFGAPPPRSRPRRRIRPLTTAAVLLTTIGAALSIGPWFKEDAAPVHSVAAPQISDDPASTSTLIATPPPAAPRPAAVQRTPPPKHVTHSAPSPTRTLVVERPVPQPTLPPLAIPVAAVPPPAPGTLYLNATPWGAFSIDGTEMGNTPAIGVSIAAGRHLIRVRRDGYVPVQLWVDVAPGTAVRLTAITLRELTP